MERRLVPERFPRQQGRGREVFSGLDVRTSFRNLGLLHRFRGRYSEDSFGVFAANEDAVVAGSRRRAMHSWSGSTRAVALARGSPAFRPAWPESLPLGWGSLRGRSFRFLTPFEMGRSPKKLLAKPLERGFT